MNMSKPSIYDYKYSHMEYKDLLLNYERDCALYEQTEALNKLSNNTKTTTLNNNNYTSSTSLLTPTEYRIDTMNNTNKFICNTFEIGSPEYINYERLHNEYLEILNLINNLDTRVKGFIFFIFSCIICLGVPTIFIVNNSFIKPLVILSLIVIFIINITINITIMKLSNKAQTIYDTLLAITYENTKHTLPKKYSRKITRKPKKVFHLEN